MNFDVILGMLIGFIFFLFILLTAPIWGCYLICKRLNWKIIKNLYQLWYNKLRS